MEVSRKIEALNRDRNIRAPNKMTTSKGGYGQRRHTPDVHRAGFLLCI